MATPDTLRSASLSRQSSRQGRLTPTGFTLVELVTVMVVLGVLAAVALPRYSDLQGQARAAKANALAGAVRAAAAMVRASAETAGVSCATNKVSAGVTLEGLPIDLNYCYPQALSSVSGILGAANIDVSADGVSASGGTDNPGAAVVLDIVGAATAGSCTVTYTSPAAPGSPPAVAAVTSGC